jgi:hypothetical protein
MQAKWFRASEYVGHQEDHTKSFPKYMHSKDNILKPSCVTQSYNPVPRSVPAPERSRQP